MKRAAFYLRYVFGATAVWLAFTPAASAQSVPLFTAIGDHGGAALCTIANAGGTDSPTPVVFLTTCDAAAASASASPGALTGSASATNIGNSVMVSFNTTATRIDDFVFTSTDPNATTANVALNLEFAARLHAVAFLSSARVDVGLTVSGVTALSFAIQLGDGGSGPALFVDENSVTTINDSSGVIDPNTYEHHVLLRTPFFAVPLNTPMRIILDLGAHAGARDSGVAAVGFATLGFPTGIDVFTLPAGVTANAPGSFLVNNRFVPPAPDISVAPTSYDFGNVKLGSSTNTIITLANVGSLDLTVSGVGLENGSSSAIAVAPAPALPAVIHPNGTLDVPLTYTPVSTAGDQAILDITSNDPDQGLLKVGLSGLGVPATVPPLQQIVDIVAFIETSVAGGSLIGSGPANSRPGRLNALRNMILAAGDLIHDGFIGQACGQLLDAYQRTDGVPNPPDFVAGPSATDLALLIQHLRTTLGCH